MDPVAVLPRTRNPEGASVAQEVRERLQRVKASLDAPATRTQHNNGLLIYVLLADRAVEIVDDRGIYDKVGVGEWQVVCRQLESAFKRSDFEGGAMAGIRALTEQLLTHFPATRHGANKSPDEPVPL